MQRDVVHSLEVLFQNFGISNIPIKCHITLRSLLHQEIVEEMAKVIIVGFAIERERAAVLKEHVKLWWELMVQVKGSDSSFTFKNLLPLRPQALPWQKSPKEVK